MFLNNLGLCQSTIGYDEEGANATEKLRNLTQSSVVTRLGKTLKKWKIRRSKYGNVCGNY